MKTTTGTAVFREIHAKDKHAWTRLLWDEAGRVIILSDYGTWSHFWGYRGEGVSVEKFLSRLDQHYMGKKMLGASLMEFSLELTAQSIREHIKEMRQCGSLSRSEATGEWELSEQLKVGDMSFDSWMQETEFEDAWEFYCREMCSEWVNFWDRLWVPMIQPELKRLSKIG